MRDESCSHVYSISEHNLLQIIISYFRSGGLTGIDVVLETISSVIPALVTPSVLQ